MKHLIRNYLIWLFGRKKRVGKRVICLHEAEHEEKFERRIAWLCRNYYVVPLTRLLSDPDVPLPAVALTFDDRFFYDWENRVFPICDKHEVTPTFFVSGGLPFSDFGNANAPINTQWVFRQVGSHTQSHFNLQKITEIVTLETQIHDHMIDMRRKVGRQLTSYFAYPYGGPGTWNCAVKKVLMDNPRITHAFTTIPGFYTEDTDPYECPRDQLDINQPEWLWRAWLNGGYDRLFRIRHWREFR